MKRNLIAVLSLGLLSFLFNATVAYTQSELRANVPFGFKVGNAQMPAGSYRINSNRGNNTITLSDGKSAAVSLVRPVYPATGSPRLVFHRVGNNYFLSEIWGPAGDGGLTLPTSTLGKELQIAAGRSNNGETIVVAVK